MRRSLFVGLLIACLAGACGQAVTPSPPPAPIAPATTPTLTITSGGATARFTAAQLLARTDATALNVEQDVAYKRAMTFRAVPLRALLGADSGDTLEVRATDGFVAQLPRALIDGAATPWIAVEDPAQPWPNLPDKTASAGPFYLIWQNPERAGVSPEQWPYQMAALSAVSSPAQRWPTLAVDASVPAHAPARRGQAVFAANCLSCHRLGGAGEGEIGPDLLRPMAATSYFSDAGLRALIRNPAAVRTWPQQQMPAFTAETISDADVNAVIAYLHDRERRRGN